MKQLHLALVFALFLFLWPLGIGAAWAAPHETLSGELILKLRPNAALDTRPRRAGRTPPRSTAAARRRCRRRRLAWPRQRHLPRARAPRRRSRALARQLAANPDVVFAEPNHTRTMMRTPNDPVLGQQWALRDIHAYEAWDITTGGDVTIALLDTGVSPSHPDLKSKLLRGRDLSNNDDDPSDDEGHGTYTAGVAAANSDNGTGIAGICWGCKILPVKVLGSRGQGDDATIAAGIRWAVDQGVRIISMSLGGPDDTDVMRDAVAYAHDHNVLIIAASGNGQAEGNLPNYPAAYPSVLAVAATNSTDGVTGFSTTGGFVDIAAPGVGVWSTIWTDEGEYLRRGQRHIGGLPACGRRGRAGAVAAARPDRRSAGRGAGGRRRRPGRARQRS